jgi:predicted  nucleic acid-binding Zn-ribbon protein
VKNKEELSKKIEILEGSIAEKENNIMDFSKKSNNELINIKKVRRKNWMIKWQL